MSDFTKEEIQFLKEFARVRTAVKGPQATSVDIDGLYGDPEIRKDPKYINGKPYKGPSFVGRKYSQCPSDYLIGVAMFLEWTVGQDKDKGEDARKSDKGVFYWTYNEKDALKARAWAKRNEGKTFAVAESSSVETEEVPF